MVFYPAYLYQTQYYSNKIIDLYQGCLVILLNEDTLKIKCLCTLQKHTLYNPIRNKKYESNMPIQFNATVKRLNTKGKTGRQLSNLDREKDTRSESELIIVQGNGGHGPIYRRFIGRKSNATAYQLDKVTPLQFIAQKAMSGLGHL